MAELDFGKFEDNHIDLFGDAYEYLISNYAANAGKSGGEFSPHKVFPNSLLKLQCTGKPRSIKFMTLQQVLAHFASSQKQFDEHIIEEGFSGRKLTIPHTTLPV